MLVIVLLASLFLQIAQATPTPPFLVENIQIKIETTTKVTIRWTTTVGTKSYIEYYPEENFTIWGIKGIPIIKEPYNVIDPKNEPSPTDNPYILNHWMTLTGLKPNTTYLFRIKAKDIYDYPENHESNFTTHPVPFWAWGGLASDSVFRRGNIVFQDLKVTPEEIDRGDNVTIQFKITNNGDQEENIGFILEHHPPAYLIKYDENVTLPYFQYAKSVLVPPNQTIIYKYTLRSSNYYHGVNSIIINYQGSQTIAETFTVNEIKDVSSIGSDSQSTSLTTRTYLENILEVLALILALIVLAVIVFRGIRNIKERWEI